MSRPQDEAVAFQFHEAYERLAPKYGYETRSDTRQFDVNSANGKLMVAVCVEITASVRAETVAEAARVCKKLEETHRRKNNYQHAAGAAFCAQKISKLSPRPTVSREFIEKIAAKQDLGGYYDKGYETIAEESIRDAFTALGYDITEK